MTPEKIRTMDGEALTKLAWELGLAPSGASVAGGIVWLSSAAAETRTWKPHEDLDQAGAVFRSLRGLGWDTFHRHGQTLSFVSAVRWATAPTARDERRIDVTYGLPDQDTEALALLRVSLLAVASEPEER